MESKIEITVAEAIECYYNLVKLNKAKGFDNSNFASVAFAEKLRDFLLEEGVLV